MMLTFGAAQMTATENDMRLWGLVRESGLANVTPLKPKVDPVVQTRVHFEAFQALVFRVALRLVFNRALAQDFTQETFVRALAFVAEGGVMDNPRAWLLQVVTRLAHDEHRRRKRWSWVPFLDTSNAFLFDVDLLQTRSLQQALDRLPTKQKVAVVLVDVEGLTGAEAAQALDCSTGAVEQLLQRGRRALRKELNDDT
jgi:RNA polymerase sigma-70 factor, ECF subfamily